MPYRGKMTNLIRVRIKDGLVSRKSECLGSMKTNGGCMSVCCENCGQKLKPYEKHYCSNDDAAFKSWWDENRKRSDGWTQPEERDGFEVWNAAIEYLKSNETSEPTLD